MIIREFWEEGHFYSERGKWVTVEMLCRGEQ